MISRGHLPGLVRTEVPVSSATWAQASSTPVTWTAMEHRGA